METDKQDGVIHYQVRMTVSQDGKLMQVTEIDNERRTQMTYTMQKKAPWQTGPSGVIIPTMSGVAYLVRSKTSFGQFSLREYGMHIGCSLDERKA